MDSPEAGVLAAVEAYVAGVSANDESLVLSAFRPDAVMWGYLGGQDIVVLPATEFARIVAGSPDPAGWVAGYQHRVRSIEVTGDVAVAVLEENGYLGTADFTNYFSLVKADGAWRIAAKAFYLTGGKLPAPPAD